MPPCVEDRTAVSFYPCPHRQLWQLAVGVAALAAHGSALLLGSEIEADHFLHPLLRTAMGA